MVDGAMKTVRVRIAVAVTESGDWSACGGKGMLDEDCRSAALDGLGDGDIDSVHWIVADVPIPESTQIEGTVE